MRRAASRKITDTVIKNAKIVGVFNSKINELGITGTVEPVMPLCFMALPVIHGAYYKLDGVFRPKLPMENTYYRKPGKN